MKEEDIKDSVIMSDVTIKSGARINYSIIDHDSIINENAVIGRTKSDSTEITIIGSNIEIERETDIPSGCVIVGNNTDRE